MSTSVLRDPSPPKTGTTRRGATGLFRAFWRWHFYASFLVVPILLVLSTTGLIYLFRFQLEPLLHPDLLRVETPGGAALQQPYAAQQKAVEAADPDATIVSMTEPGGLDQSTRFSVTTADGQARDVFVDPWTADVLGSLNPDTTLSGYAVRLHGELMAGKYGDHIIELGACWALMMALTGFYLFFKGRKARKRARSRGTPGAGLRQRHALVGVFVGAGLLLVLASGLPWTGLWGAKAQEFATSQDTSLWSQDHGAVSEPTSRLDESLPHSHKAEVPWGQGARDVPRSTGDPHGSVANLDTAVAVADGEGLRHPMTVAIPATEDGVFSVIGHAFDAPQDERTVHVDRFGGDVVSTYGFEDYPVLAKVVSLGIGLHEGRSLGAWSFAGSALMCLAVMFSCISGPLMWWRRRPAGGSMGAPRGRMPLRATPLLGLGVVALGLFLPMFGLSLLVVLLLDQLVIRRGPKVKEFFGSV